MAHAVQLAVLAVAAAAVALCARRSRRGAAWLLSALLAVLSSSTFSLAYLSLRLTIWSGGRVTPADAMAWLPLRGARYFSLAVVAALLVHGPRSWRALLAGVVVAASPWALDGLDAFAADAAVLARADLQGATAEGFPKVSTLASTRAPPRWIRTGAALPDRFSIGRADDGDYARAWACGVSPAGAVVCFRPEHDRLELRTLATTTPAVDIQVGLEEACAVDAAGAIACFRPDGSPVPTPRLEPALAVGLGTSGWACIRTRAAMARCWQQPALDDAHLLAVDVRSLSVGFHDGACIASTDGTARCWDRRRTRSGLGEVVPLEGTSIAEIVASDDVACTRDTGGRVRCSGQGGVASAPAGGGIEQVAVTDDHACERDRTGAVRCWGADEWGQTRTERVDDASWVAVGDGVTCARRTAGIVCYGRGRR